MSPNTEAPPPKQGPRIGFAAAFGLGIVPVALLLVVHGRAGSPPAAPPSSSPSALEQEGPVSARSEQASARDEAAKGAPRVAAEQAEKPATAQEYFRTLEALRRSAPEEALRWVERGEEWYGKAGPEAEARDAMQVTLLVDLGRMREARAVTDRFIVEYPDSQYRPLVQGMTGIHPRPGPPEHVASRQH